MPEEQETGAAGEVAGAGGASFGGDAVYSALRAELRRMRLESRLTQTALGERMEWSASTVARVEAGDRPVDLLEFYAWCRACGAEPGDVLQQVVGRRL